MRYSIAAVLVVGTLLASAAAAQTPDPKKLKDQLTGDAKGAASSNPQCRLFTQGEISKYAGAPLGPGENAGGGTGCMWSDKSYDSSAMVTVVPAKYFPEPKLAKGFKRLPSPGSRAWVAEDSGWSAGALVQDEGIVVEVAGTKATEASAVALLQEVVKRRRK